jgi:hypothetical protein
LNLCVSSCILRDWGLCVAPIAGVSLHDLAWPSLSQNIAGIEPSLPPFIAGIIWRAWNEIIRISQTDKSLRVSLMDNWLQDKTSHILVFCFF